jgi:hypothetical protein
MIMLRSRIASSDMKKQGQSANVSETAAKNLKTSHGKGHKKLDTAPKAFTSTEKQNSQPTKAGESVATAKEMGPNAHKDILLYSLFASFTPFIPLPFVDNMAENRVERMMIQKISQSYGATLGEDDLVILASKADGNLIKKIGFGAAKKLIKKIAIKTTLIFLAKDASDTFSSCYHIGYLIDYAYQTQLVKRYSPRVIRRAVDRVCSQFNTSLVNRVFFQVLRESASLLGVAKDFLVQVMIGESSDKSASDNISEEIPTEAMDVVELIQTKLDLLPPSYFIELRRRFTEELAKK